MARKIYCAGPLFNVKEKEEMAEIAAVLEAHSFEVFLPQRDGIEFADLVESFDSLGIPEGEARDVLNRAVFSLDVVQVLDSDGLVLNMNGRVPDEGAVVEAGIAWSAGKRVVIFKNDTRTLVSGNDNPLLLGLSDFTTVDNISKIPEAFDKLFGQEGEENNTISSGLRLEKISAAGRRIRSLTSNGHEKVDVCQQLIRIVGNGDAAAVR